MTYVRAISRTVPAVTVDGGCSEDLVYGSNILRDPGFENHLTDVPSGPAGQDFPSGNMVGGATLGRVYWDLPGGSPNYITDDLYYDTNGWAVWQTYDSTSDPSIVGIQPYVSTANPLSGTHHYRADVPADYVDQWVIAPVGGGTCTSPRLAYSCRVEPGDTIAWGANAMKSNAADTWQVYTDFAFYDVDHNNLGGGPYDAYQLLTSSYNLVDQAYFAPANAHYARVVLGFFAQSGFHAAVTVDVDDAYLSLMAA